MKKYVAVKIVEAEQCKAWKQSGEYNIGDDGYKVKYPDGYLSWCPKDVFEKANTDIDNYSKEQIVSVVEKACDEHVIK